MIKTNNNYSKKNSDIDYDEINFQPFIYTILRNKLLVFLFTLISTSISIIYSYSVKPIYRGSFEIVVADGNTDARDSIKKIDSLLRAEGGATSSTATQELILKSPSVLMPVFDYVKSEYRKKGLEISNMDYKSWFRREVKINFKDRTQVLSVAYLNNDKDLIIKTLNKISNKYQDFSKSVVERQINQGISYLEKQEKINKEKLVLKYQKLNKFSIKNGIGADGGFVTLNQLDVSPNIQQEPDQSANYNSRFRSQFRELEQNETLYKIYSSKLKPNSKFLKEIDLKINSLRESLKRPNEILITYKQLVRETKNQEELLKNITEQLSILKFRKAKQVDPWQLISNPALDKQKVFPNKKNIVLIGFLISFTFITFLLFLIKKKEGTLYGIKEVNKNLQCNFIESLNLSNFGMCINFLEVQINQLVKNGHKNIGIYALNATRIDKFDLLLNELTKDQLTKKITLIDLFDKNSIEDCDLIIIFIQSGEVNIKDLDLLSKYINLYEDKIYGWIFLENTL